MQAEPQLQQLIRITTSYMVAGVILNENNVVVEAAPILSYMRGWPKEKVLTYCAQRGYVAEVGGK